MSKYVKINDRTQDGTITIFLSKFYNFLFYNIFYCFRTYFTFFRLYILFFLRTSYSILECPFPVFWFLLGKWFCPGMSQDRKKFCPGTSQDRRVSPKIFAPALFPEQRDSGTRKYFCPGTKRHWNCVSALWTIANYLLHVCWSNCNTQFAAFFSWYVCTYLSGQHKVVYGLDGLVQHWGEVLLQNCPRILWGYLKIF